MYGDHGRTYGAGMDDLAIADRENFPPEPHHAQGTANGSFYFSYGIITRWTKEVSAKHYAKATAAMENYVQFV